jgi:hypothetical protein
VRVHEVDLKAGFDAEPGMLCLVGGHPLPASLALPSTAIVAVEIAPKPALPSTEPPAPLPNPVPCGACGVSCPPWPREKGELIAVFGVPVISETRPFR